jgi:hypothetical protein
MPIVSVTAASAFPRRKHEWAKPTGLEVVLELRTR